MNIIRRTRLLAEISQGDVARAVGIDQGRLSQIETGKIAVKPERRKQILNAIQRLATLKAREAGAVAKVRAEFSEEAHAAEEFDEKYDATPPEPPTSDTPGSAKTGMEDVGPMVGVNGKPIQ